MRVPGFRGCGRVCLVSVKSDLVHGSVTISASKEPSVTHVRSRTQQLRPSRRQRYLMSGTQTLRPRVWLLAPALMALLFCHPLLAAQTSSAHGHAQDTHVAVQSHVRSNRTLPGAGKPLANSQTRDTAPSVPTAHHTRQCPPPALGRSVTPRLARAPPIRV